MYLIFLLAIIGVVAVIAVGFMGSGHGNEQLAKERRDRWQANRTAAADLAAVAVLPSAAATPVVQQAA